LAQQVNQYLDRRSAAYLNGWWEGQLDRDAQLLALAAEVAEAIGPLGAIQ